MIPTIKFENLKIYRTFNNHIYSSKIGYNIIEKIVFKGITFVTGTDGYVKRKILSLFENDFQKEDSCIIKASFSYNNYPISEDKFIYFFNTNTMINENDTVKDAIKYIIAFSSTKLDFEKLVKDFRIKNLLNKKIYMLSNEEKDVFSLVCKIAQLPRIILFVIKKESFFLLKSLNLYSRLYNIIFIIPCNQIINYDFIDQVVEIEKDQYRHKIFETEEVVLQDMMETMNFDEHLNFLVGDIAPIETKSDNTSNENSEVKEGCDKNIDLIINNKLHTNYIRKISDMNPVRRIFCIDNYKIKIYSIYFLTKRMIFKNYKSGDKFFCLLLFIIFYFGMKFYTHSDQFCKNLFQSFSLMNLNIATCVFRPFKDLNQTINHFDLVFKLILDNLIYPIFSDFRIDDNIQNFNLIIPKENISNFNYVSALIHFFIFEGALNAAGLELKVVKQNLNIFFTPATFLLSIIFYLIITHWIPILAISSIFFGSFPILILISASSLSLVLLTIRYFSYDIFKKKYVKYVFILCFIYIIWLEPHKCNERLCNFLYFTRKLNPVFISRYYYFLTGKIKWKFIGYSIRSFILLFILCIYQISKV